MQQSNQETYPYLTDEISLGGSIKALVERKLLILGLTGFITLLAIIYSLNITPTYKVISSFVSPSDISVVNFNKLGLANKSKESIFKLFLTNLSSKNLQTKVFLDGGFLTAFNPKNELISNVDQVIFEYIDSVKLSMPEMTKRDMDLGFLTEKPYSISMEGTNSVAMKNFLNELVAQANIITVNALFDTVKQRIVVRLDELTIERKLLLIKKKQERLNEIEQLIQAAKIAKSLGIIESNFSNYDLYDNNIKAGLVDLGESKVLPDWYLYGEKALLARVKLLEARTTDIAFVPEVVDIDIEKLKLESYELNTGNISSMTLSQVAVAPTSPFKPNKRLIVLLAFFGGFMVSILLALAMNTLKFDENSPS